MSLPAAVFASGTGTNLQALLDHEHRHDAAYRIVAAVCDREGAGALERARDAGRESRVVPMADRSPADAASELAAVLEETGAEAIFLAGYLRLVPASIVRRFSGRILNVHPALLPAFGGKGMYGIRVHEAVLERGAQVTGVTVHLVNEIYDEGRILAQWPVAVRPGDTPRSLAARVLEVEHALYPLAADHLCRALRGGGPPRPMELFSDTFLLGLDPPDYELRHQIRRAFGDT